MENLFGGFTENQAVVGKLTAATTTPEGTVYEAQIGMMNQEDPASAREIIGAAFDVDPETVAIHGVGVHGIGSRAASGGKNRTTFGFADTKWNAKWTPSRNKQIDPLAS